MEYVYYLMAKEAGINMEFCDLLPEGDRRHFITKRFDRLNGNEKRHIQTLTAIDHVNYSQPGAYSYEQVFKVKEMDVEGLDQVKEMFNEEFLNQCMQRFLSMRTDFVTSFKRVTN